MFKRILKDWTRDHFHEASRFLMYMIMCSIFKIKCLFKAFQPMKIFLRIITQTHTWSKCIWKTCRKGNIICNMTHGVRKIKINQRFSRNTTIPGSGFYKIDLQGKDTIIKIHYTSAVNPHPFRPSHLVKLKKTHGGIIYGNISLPYSSCIFLLRSEL